MSGGARCSGTFFVRFPVKDLARPVAELKAEAVERVREAMDGLGLCPSGRWSPEVLHGAAPNVEVRVPVTWTGRAPDPHAIHI